MDLDDLKKAAAELPPALTGDIPSNPSGWGPSKDEANSRRTDFFTVDGEPTSIPITEVSRAMRKKIVR